MARVQPAPPLVQPHHIAPRGRSRDVGLLREYVHREQRNAIPFLEHLLAVGNTTMREAAFELLNRLDAPEAERQIVALLAALAGKKTVKASKERMLLGSLLLQAGTLSALKVFLAAGGSGITERRVCLAAIWQLLHEQIPGLDLEGVTSLLTRTSTSLESVWLEGEETWLSFAALLLAHPQSGVRELARQVVEHGLRGSFSPRYLTEATSLASTLMRSPSWPAREVGARLLQKALPATDGGFCSIVAVQLGCEFLDHPHAETQALGGPLLVRYAGLAGLRELATRGLTLPFRDLLVLFLDRWSEAFEALSPHLDDPEHRRQVAYSARQYERPLDDRWLARFEPHLDEDEVLTCLVAYRHPPAIERARELATSDTFGPRTALACKLLSGTGDTSCAAHVLRWWLQEWDRPESGGLWGALGQCGDASALAAIKALRVQHSFRYRNDELYMLARDIRRRIERW